MIGTIIIAVTGYGVALYLLLITIGAIRVFWREPEGSLEENRAARWVMVCLSLAVLIAVITRWLAGG